MSIYEQFKKIGIVPVVVLDDPKDAEPLAKALIEVAYLVQKLLLEQLLPKSP